ncbi:MAG: phospholipid scramblase-related protein [Clostridia bacterium]|nr:phospholipid scramblase-related protein [Clostridia bacterium]MDD4048800.1 phospholipid scramblase-related protein [Clostridia bacterium]
MLLDNKVFFIKEQVDFMKLVDAYDILEPESGMQIGIAKEVLVMPMKILKFLFGKKILPTRVNVYDDENQEIVFYIKKYLTVRGYKVVVCDDQGELIGYFKNKVMTISGGFYVYDNVDREIAEIRGDWKGWNFRFLNTRAKRIGYITKKWGGIGKELFETSNSYMIFLEEIENLGQKEKALLLAAGLAIDIIYKEKE